MNVEQMFKQMEIALKKFEDTGANVDNLAAEVVRLSARMQALSDVRRNTRSRNALFQICDWDSEAQAKTFVDYMAALQRQDGAAIRALNEDTPGTGDQSEGGYVVPAEFRPVLLRIVEQFGLLRQKATIIPMGRDEVTFPNLASGVTVYWPDENAAITESQPAFGTVKLIVKKMAALVPSSIEFLDDAAIPIASLLATLVGEAMAKEEDRVGFVGNTGGGDPFDGLLFAAGTNSMDLGTGDTSYVDITAEDLLSLTTTISTGASQGAEFLFHRTIFNHVRTLKESTSGAYIFAPASSAGPATLWGYPFTLVDSFPGVADDAADKALIAFGNMRHLYLGDRQRLVATMSPHYKFNLDQLFFKFTQRIAIKVAMPPAFGILKTSAA